MTKLQVYFNSIQYKFVKKKTDQLGISLAEYIRNLIDREIAKEQQETVDKQVKKTTRTTMISRRRW